jgi:CheY-like chemotaxis protein
MLRPDPLRDVVLIVDDAPENLSILHTLLDKSGYTVLVATDGAGALDRARRLPPDLILLDAVRPADSSRKISRPERFRWCS